MREVRLKSKFYSDLKDRGDNGVSDDREVAVRVD